MVEITMSVYLAVPLALLGSAWIYHDAKKREMDTADMWAVGFFVGFFVPPFIGAIAVYAFYLQKRNRRGGTVHAVPPE
ncbi:hypothetical protein SAMN05421858_2225 [Haladaptatus litoreus]|uniref:Uncharacterized protein n=1 Tax=Haladaptatus litoreus TaxID=553468 RepID=A0A1N6ZY29_9EURY|nr:hypothetical protein [Haladaptatus litoreus]SIR31666.1 hypothetical protein SAMN05421858_2225 [Haladaptatus litoreus]